MQGGLEIPIEAIYGCYDKKQGNTRQVQMTAERKRWGETVIQMERATELN